MPTSRHGDVIRILNTILNTMLCNVCVSRVDSWLLHMSTMLFLVCVVQSYYDHAVMPCANSDLNCHARHGDMALSINLCLRILAGCLGRFARSAVVSS